MLGQDIEISRRGTGGDIGRAVALYRELDGTVDAIGVGGIEFFMMVDGRRHYWRSSKPIRTAVHISKVGDGNGVRAVLAERAVRALEQQLNGERRTLKGMKALKL